MWDASGESASNQSENHRGFPHLRDGEFGIDRVGVAFPTEPGTPRVRKDVAVGDGCNVHVETRLEGRPHARLDGNPSRWYDPTGRLVCPADLVLDFLREVVWPAVLGFARPVVDAASAIVTRLDAARDFVGVVDIERLVRGLASLPRPWARSHRITVGVDEEGRRGVTLYAGGKREHVALYDRHGLHPHAVEEGVTRFEVRARKPWARRAEVQVVADIDAARVWGLIQDRWNWSGMGSEVASRQTLADRVSKADWNERERADFVWSLLQRSSGLEPPLSRDRRARINRLHRELGVALNDVELGEGPTESLRLDLIEGRQITEPVAAAAGEGRQVPWI